MYTTTKVFHSLSIVSAASFLSLQYPAYILFWERCPRSVIYHFFSFICADAVGFGNLRPTRSRNLTSRRTRRFGEQTLLRPILMRIKICTVRQKWWKGNSQLDRLIVTHISAQTFLFIQYELQYLDRWYIHDRLEAHRNRGSTGAHFLSALVQASSPSPLPPPLRASTTTRLPLFRA